MESERKTVRTKRGVREYTSLGCAVTRNRANWCFRLCPPDAQGRGRCGRIAPHSLQGRTQLSIQGYNQKQMEAHWEKLEHLYLSAPGKEECDAGIKISDGLAEIVIPMQEKFLEPSGNVSSSICFTAMNDSAAFAVNSVVVKSLVTTAEYHIHFARSAAQGDLVARSRFVGTSEDYYLAESVLLDTQGNELGQGSGVFRTTDAAMG